MPGETALRLSAISSRPGNDSMPSVPVVLVVEDELPVQTTICAALTLMGFKPHRAATVDAALTILGADHVDAVSLDIRLPDPTGLYRSGLSLLPLLRAMPEYARVPVLIFTGNPLSPEDEELARHHDAHVFYKPQPYSVLIEHLSRLLQDAPGLEHQL
jgi:CheY-like chemotaxis protein